MSEKTVTALYDFRSKQAYIYRTNRIREIAGASELLAHMYEEWIRVYNACKDTGCIIDDWKNSDRPFCLQRFLDGDSDGEVIYMGGGNLYILYRSVAIYRQANRLFSRYVLDHAYSLGMVVSYTETTGDFALDRRRLYEENRNKKNTDEVTLPCNVLPYTQVDRLTFQPVIKKTVQGKQQRSLSREAVMKLHAYEWYVTARDSSSTVELDDIVTEKGTESLLAVIYIDGNAMGDRVRAATAGKTGYDDCVSAMRRFSLETQEDFVDKPLTTIHRVLTELEKQQWGKFRRVIGGGDEITIICNAHAALPIVLEYFRTLGSEGKGNYACAGIAICHSHDPFSAVYRIAEACCESGKARTRGVAGDHGKRNYVDFHYCRSGITGSFENIRDEQEAEFTQRPFRVEEELRYFCKIGEACSHMVRADVKALGEAIIQGDSEFRFTIQRLAAKYTDAKKYPGVPELLEQAIQSKALLFDVCSVYDIWFAGGKEEEK